MSPPGRPKGEHGSAENEGGAPAAHAGVLGRAQLTLIGSVVGGALAIANEILCARYLGTRVYGLYALALILARVGEAVSVLGLRIATIHFLSIHRDRGEREHVIGTVWASLLPPLVLGLALALVVWAAAPLLAHRVFGDPEAEPFIAAMAFSIPLLGLSEVLAIITRGYGHAGYYVVIRNLAPPLAYLALLALIVANGASPTWIPYAFGAAYLVAVLIGVWCLLRVTGRDLFRVKPVLPFRALYTYSMPVLVNNLLYLVIGWTDILMLGILNSGTQVGIYRACMQLAMPFDLIVMAFNAAVGHVYPVLVHNKRQAELAALVDKITRWMAMLALTGLLMLAYSRTDLLLLMGPDFASGATALVVLAAGYATLCCVGSAGFLLVISGHQKNETFNAATAAVLNLGLNAVLIGRYGSTGAAAATSIACLYISVARVIQVRRLMAIDVVRPSIVKILALGALGAAIAFGVEAVVPIDAIGGIPGIALRSALVLAIFGALYWVGGMSRDERDAVRALAGRARR